MPMSENAKSAAATYRKLRSLTAVVLDPAATEPERANAERLKARLENQLEHGATSEARWTGVMFRLGRGVKEITSAASSKSDFTDRAFRLGKMLRKGFKK